MEKENEGDSWNKKKISIAIFSLALLIIGGIFLKTKVLVGSSQTVGLVKGVATEENVSESRPSINIQEAVKDRINTIKQEVSGLDLVEIASTSPQVQKILNDVKSLQQYPTNQLKEICRQICGL